MHHLLEHNFYKILILGDGEYNLPHVYIVIFPENKFAFSFMHTTVNILGKRKRHEMQEWHIPRVNISLFFEENGVLVLNGITVYFYCILH